MEINERHYIEQSKQQNISNQIHSIKSNVFLLIIRLLIAIILSSSPVIGFAVLEHPKVPA